MSPGFLLFLLQGLSPILHNCWQEHLYDAPTSPYGSGPAPRMVPAARPAVAVEIICPVKLSGG